MASSGFDAGFHTDPFTQMSATELPGSITDIGLTIMGATVVLDIARNCSPAYSMSVTQHRMQSRNVPSSCPTKAYLASNQDLSLIQMNIPQRQIKLRVCANLPESHGNSMLIQHDSEMPLSRLSLGHSGLQALCTSSILAWSTTMHHKGSACGSSGTEASSDSCSDKPVLCEEANVNQARVRIRSLCDAFLKSSVGEETSPGDPKSASSLMQASSSMSLKGLPVPGLSRAWGMTICREVPKRMSKASSRNPGSCSPDFFQADSVYEFMIHSSP